MLTPRALMGYRTVLVHVIEPYRPVEVCRHWPKEAPILLGDGTPLEAPAALGTGRWIAPSRLLGHLATAATSRPFALMIAI